MAETYKSIADCDHANLALPEMGGCPDCNYTVGTILAVAEDRLAAARADAAKYRAALEAMTGTWAEQRAYMDAQGLDTSDEEALATPNAWCGIIARAALEPKP